MAAVTDDTMEHQQMRDGDAASEIMAHPLFRRSFDDLRSVYASKMITAPESDVLRWRRLIEVLDDHETMFLAYIDTGEAIKAKVGAMQATADAMRRAGSRVSRFMFGEEKEQFLGE